MPMGVRMRFYCLFLVCLAGCGDTITKHYHYGSDATATLPDGGQPVRVRDCRYAEDACAEGFVCSIDGDTHVCVPSMRDGGVGQTPSDAMLMDSIDAMVSEMDAMPEPLREVYPENIGPVRFRRPMGEFAYEPAFDIDGQMRPSFSLSEFRQNDARWGEYDYLVIMVGAEWCAPCREMMQNLDAEAAQFGALKTLFLYMMKEKADFEPANSSDATRYVSTVVQDLPMVRVGSQRATHSEGLYDRLRGTGQAGQIPAFIVVRRHDGAIVNQVDEPIETADDLRLILLDGESPVFIAPTSEPDASPEQLTERCDGASAGDLQVNTLRLQEAWPDAICGPNEPEFFAVGEMMLGGYDIDLFVNLERSFGRDNRLDLSFYSVDLEESEELVPVDTVELEPIEPMGNTEGTLYARLERPLFFSIAASNQDAVLEYSVEYRVEMRTAEALCEDPRMTPWVQRDEAGRILMEGLAIRADALCDENDSAAYLISPKDGVDLLVVIDSDRMDGVVMSDVVNWLDPDDGQLVDNIEIFMEIDNLTLFQVRQPVVLQVPAGFIQAPLRYGIATQPLE